MEKILVIDDDVMSRKMAEHILTRNGYEVILASSGKQGIDILREKTVSLVLLDIEMPVMNGYETLKHIREDERLAETKVIFLTGIGQREGIDGRFEQGVLDHIRKPFFPADFIERIKRVLNTKSRELILVVDDEPMNIMLTKKILGTNYQVEGVSSGLGALEFIQNRKPDLVLLDLHMPQMNGMEVLKAIQENEETADIPVVFLTADYDRDTEAELFKAGAMDYIRKPFVTQVAIQRINRILELKHLQASLQDEVNKKTEELEQSNRKIENLSRQIMYALSGAVDAKDSYTNGHSNRVADYSRELARRMGKTQAEMDEIYYIALLHDVGKIGISNVIINKPGKLTDEEYETIKSHTTVGARILENISEMPLLKIGARWHHERYDGKGYPDGLKGDNIPEIARIICVADCYDAMSSNRSYRKALPQQVVRAEIEKGKGTQFDPDIADLMLQMIDEDVDYDMQEK